MKKRIFLKATTIMFASLLMTGYSNSAFAEWKPKRPISVVVPYKAGGGADTFARTTAAIAKDIMKVPLVIVNKPGSSGIAGAKMVASAKPDGLTMMVTSSGSFLLTSMMRQTNVNPFDDFRMVAQIGNINTSLIVPKNSPFQTVADLLKIAKEKPNTLRWAHTGRGGMHNVAGQGFLDLNNITAQDVPFKGGSAVRAAVIGEQVDFAFGGIQQAAGFEEQLRVLAVNAPERDGVMNHVPTFAEQEVKYVDISSPIIAFVPKQTSDEAVSFLQDKLKQITAVPKFTELMQKQGNQPAFLTAQQAEEKLLNMKQQATPVVKALKAGNE